MPCLCAHQSNLLLQRGMRAYALRQYPGHLVFVDARLLVPFSVDSDQLLDELARLIDEYGRKDVVGVIDSEIEVRGFGAEEFRARVESSESGKVPRENGAGGDVLCVRQLCDMQEGAEGEGRTGS